MEGYIALIEIAGNRWELTVRLPNKFLRQYLRSMEVSVFGQNLAPNWGYEYIEESGVQPWRYRSQVYCSLDKAEAAAAEIMQQVDAAKASLKPKGYVRYTLSLSEDGPVIKQEERQGPAENKSF